MLFSSWQSWLWTTIITHQCLIDSLTLGQGVSVTVTCLFLFTTRTPHSTGVASAHLWVCGCNYPFEFAHSMNEALRSQCPNSKLDITITQIEVRVFVCGITLTPSFQLDNFVAGPVLHSGDHPAYLHITANYSVLFKEALYGIEPSTRNGKIWSTRKRQHRQYLKISCWRWRCCAAERWTKLRQVTRQASRVITVVAGFFNSWLLKVILDSAVVKTSVIY